MHIVDDEPAVRRSVAFLLKGVGFSSFSWESGDAFLQGFSADWRGCILLDMRMPRLSGMDVLRELKKMGSPMPVIMLAGHTDSGLSANSLKLGAFDSIEKPYEKTALLRSIAVALLSDNVDVRIPDPGPSRAS
ncbi:response regulator transcription factor [Sphingomonas sp. YR710]|uniref:response regulator transcription factor n=1 Tax=Sphingomonas sp. YR710 TaxID=1882773 RepID=UPI00159FD736|nr:response regulator [Sphingomonas sp. YR710]